MSNKLYVGSLPYSVNDEILSQIFTPYGTVESAKVITDRETGLSKGFGFVEMATEAGAAAALAQMNGAEVGGRMLKVAEAKDRPPRTGGGSYGGDRDRDGGRPRGGGSRRDSDY